MHFVTDTFERSGHGGGAPSLQGEKTLAVVAALCRRAALACALLALAPSASGIPTRGKETASLDSLISEAAPSNALARTDATAVAAVPWEENFLVASRRAASENRPILLFASMPNCGPCRMLENVTLTSPAVRQRLREFVCVKTDITEDRRTAMALGVDVTPTLVVLSSDGEERGRFSGFLQPPEFLDALSKAANGQGSEDAAARQKLQEVLALLHKQAIPADRWPDVLMAVGSERHRQTVVTAVLALQPQPKAELVKHLTHPQLAVRLGALEILEQMAGEDFGLDPWEEVPDAGESAGPALTKWQAWAGSSDTNAPALYSALTREQMTARLQDLLSDDLERSRRARRHLTLAGQAVAGLAKEFLDAHPDLASGLADRVREVRYAALLGTRTGFDGADYARRLVFGNLDTQMQALRDIRTQKAQATLVAGEFLANPNPLLRETAVDTLIAAARRDALPALRELAQREPNREVLIAIARGLRTVRTRPSAEFLASLLERDDEDLVIAALNSLARIGTFAPNEPICKRLADKRWRVRVAALQTVSELSIREGADAVEKLLADEDSFVRYTAILTLAKVADKPRTAKLLEKAFLQNDDNKPPVLAAFGQMSTALPASFVNASTGKPPEVLLPMLDALSRCEKRGVPLAKAFASHPDPDVACAALTILARHGARSSNAALVEALKRGSRGAVLSVLDSIHREDEERITFRSSYGEQDYTELLQEIENARSAAPGSAGAGSSVINDLFDSFLISNPGKPAPPPAPAVSVGDLFDAFGATQAVVAVAAPDGAPAGVESAAAEPGLLDAIRASKTRFPDDIAIEGAATLAMLRMRDPGALAALSNLVDRLPGDQKIDAAMTLRGKAAPEALAILSRFLRDPEASLRIAAAEAISQQCQLKEWCDALFGELTRQGTPLRLHEAMETLLEKQDRKPAEKDNLRRQAAPLLAATDKPPMRILGVALYGAAGMRSDASLLAPLLDAEDPLMRRAACWSMLTLDATQSTSIVSRAASDPSEDVRSVVPAMLSNGTRAWSHRFSKSEGITTWLYRRDARTLKEPERAALRRLAGDPLPELRAESMIALLSHSEPFDAAALMAAISECEDGARMGEAAADVLSSSYAKLDTSYAALLPLLEQSRMSDETRQRITAKLQGSPGLAALGVAASTNAPVVRTNATVAAAATVVERATPSPAQTNSLRLVFFHEPGCPECAEARALLASLKESFAELSIEELDIREPANRKFNALLCDKFQIPERYRARTPTLVTGAGYLVGNEITIERLADLLGRSLDKPLTEKP